MGERELLAEQILQARLSRRGLLKDGMSAPLGAALLAACQSSSATQAPTAAASAAATAAPSAAATAAATAAQRRPPRLPRQRRHPRRRRRRRRRPTTPGSRSTCSPERRPARPSTIAADGWKQLTGGTVNVEVIPFAERAIKFAGLIAGQDASVDLLYAYSGFVGQFGDRLYENLSEPPYSAIDTSAFVPAILPVLSAGGGLRAMPVHSEMEIYIYNKEMFEAAGIDPGEPPATWDELYAVRAAADGRQPLSVRGPVARDFQRRLLALLPQLHDCRGC